MKLCRYCKKSYPESDFGVALTTAKKVYRRHKCRFCYRLTKHALKDKYHDWLNSYKKEHKCSKCKIADYRVLEFHHLNSREKEFSISESFYNNFGLERIRKEVAKCVILCANCHRILHSEEKAR